MTLYYTIVFILLSLEMFLFVVLVLPLPFKIKRGLLTFISENPVIAKIQYWMKICFVFILVLFIDSVNRVYRVQVEMAAAADSNRATGGAIVGTERLEVQARKFYSQRNMYLTGFTLFLSLILNRTYIMILEVMRLEDKLRTYEGTSGDAKQSAKLAMAGNAGEVATLRSKLEEKERDLKVLKKQSSSLNAEYSALSDKYALTQKNELPKKDM